MLTRMKKPRIKVINKAEWAGGSLCFVCRLTFPMEKAGNDWWRLSFHS
jgi:hypothetical protein